MEKQIEKQAVEEMANLLWHFPKAFYLNCYTDCVEAAELLYEENYRKQSEVIAEFTESVKHIVDGVKFKNANEKTAFMEMLEDLAMTKMKGGAE